MSHGYLLTLKGFALKQMSLGNISRQPESPPSMMETPGGNSHLLPEANSRLRVIVRPCLLPSPFS